MHGRSQVTIRLTASQGTEVRDYGVVIKPLPCPVDIRATREFLRLQILKSLRAVNRAQAQMTAEDVSRDVGEVFSY